MKIINFGSINVDYVYRVKSIVAPGETISCSGMERFAGGKGANQSIAISRAGVKVMHVGQVGNDTAWMRDTLDAEGVDVKYVQTNDGVPGGCAIIQVDDKGQNSIIVLGGTNQCIPEELVKRALGDACAGDWITLQNETNANSFVLEHAHELGAKVCLNPSPITPSLFELPLANVDLLVVNKDEANVFAERLCRCHELGAENLCLKLSEALDGASICITLGGDGALFYSSESGMLQQKAFPVKPVDTTGAGDTFTGYLLAGLADGLAIAKTLERAAKAAAISVTRPGAIPSIPFASEL